MFASVQAVWTMVKYVVYIMLVSCTDTVHFHVILYFSVGDNVLEIQPADFISCGHSS